MDKGVLQKLVDEGKSSYVIAKEFSLKPSKVTYWIKKYKLVTNTISKNFKNINWSLIQKFYNDGNSILECAKNFNICKSTIQKAIKSNKFKSRNIHESRNLLVRSGKRKIISKKTVENYWTPERRKDLSEEKKQLYKDHPEKHPQFILANNRSKISYPEKMAYCFFEDNKFKFEHHFNIGKYFADFYLPETNQVIEIDGFYFHKNRKEEDGVRDKYMESLGYKIVRFPAKQIIAQLNLYFDKEYTISKEESKKRIIDIPLKEKKKCLKCEKEISRQSVQCSKCSGKLRSITYNKVKIRPTKEELQTLLDTKTYKDIGLIFGITSNSVKKWAINYGIYQRKNNIVKERQCLICPNKFKPDSNNSKQKFCSKECCNKTLRKCEKPSCEQLI